MNLLLILWVSGAAFAVQELWYEVFEKPLKPFSCAPCMSYWVGVGVALITHDFLYIFIPYLLTKIISKYLWS